MICHITVLYGGYLCPEKKTVISVGQERSGITRSILLFRMSRIMHSLSSYLQPFVHHGVSAWICGEYGEGLKSGQANGIRLLNEKMAGRN